MERCLCSLGPCQKNAKKCDGIGEDLIQIGKGVYTDWYPSVVARRGEVSLELAASREFAIKAELDGQIDQENTFDQGELKGGLPPCKRAKVDF